MSSKQDSKLEAIISRLREGYKPLRLFFYGSRAQGMHRPDADYDFVMVLSKFNDKNRYDVMSKISSELRRELGVEVQVWVYSESVFNDWKDEFSSIPETALSTGREIELG
jgi:predicted nucleotidyltransferase